MNKFYDDWMISFTAWLTIFHPKIYSFLSKIPNALRYIKNWIRITYCIIKIRIGLMLANSEFELFKSDSDIGSKQQNHQRKRHRSQLLERLNAGKEDTQYKIKFYELLKKSEYFKRNATPKRYGEVANRYAMSYAVKMPNETEKPSEHLGFFDAKSNNFGKTLDSVIKQEMVERSTKCDTLETIYMFDNKTRIKPIAELVVSEEATFKSVSEYAQYMLEEKKKNESKPIVVYRENDVNNKIEMLTDHLYVKKVGDIEGNKYRILEFLIPKKFKTYLLDPEDPIIGELTAIKEVYYTDEFGDRICFSITGFKEFMQHGIEYDVFRFNALEMDWIRIA